MKKRKDSQVTSWGKNYEKRYGKTLSRTGNGKGELTVLKRSSSCAMQERNETTCPGGPGNVTEATPKSQQQGKN